MQIILEAISSESTAFILLLFYSRSLCCPHILISPNAFFITFYSILSMQRSPLWHVFGLDFISLKEYFIARWNVVRKIRDSIRPSWKLEFLSVRMLLIPLGVLRVGETAISATGLRFEPYRYMINYKNINKEKGIQTVCSFPTFSKQYTSKSKKLNFSLRNKKDCCLCLKSKNKKCIGRESNPGRQLGRL